MRRLLALGLLIGSASLSTGCAMCCSPYDYAYGYYGGIWQRDNLCHGRVGSAYAPAAGSKVGDVREVPQSTTEPDALQTPANQPKPQAKSVKRTRPAEPYLPENE